MRNPEAYSIRKEAHPEKGVYEFRLAIPIEPPMTQWALMAGDCIHNARSALDHFYWQLVLLQHPSGQPKRAWKAGFPVYDDRDRFLNKKRDIEYFVGPTAAAILESLQPYQSGFPDDDALLFLHKSDVTDKHRLLIPSMGHLRQAQVVVRQRTGMPHDAKVNRFFHERLHDGAVLATVVVTPPEHVVDVDLQALKLGIVYERGLGAVLGVTSALAGLIAVARSIPDEFPGVFASHDAAP